MNQRTMKAARKARRTLLTLTVAGLPASAAAATAQSTAKAQQVEQTGFYCNVKALKGAERARHDELAKRLLERRQKIVETEKGYELQFRPEDLSIAELAEWATLESKCCPFLDFHIDLENERRLACLRLTGRPGIKAFI